VKHQKGEKGAKKIGAFDRTAVESGEGGGDTIYRFGKNRETLPVVDEAMKGVTRWELKLG